MSIWPSTAWRSSPPSAHNEAGWIKEIADNQVDGIFCRVDKITPAMMDASPNLKVIAKQGAGLDNIDIPYATSKKIQVVYSPAGNMQTVAEHATMLLLMCAQRYRYVDHQMRGGNFNVRYTLTGTHDLNGHTIGLIGCGRIGPELRQDPGGGLWHEGHRLRPLHPPPTSCMCPSS